MPTIVDAMGVASFGKDRLIFKGANYRRKFVLSQESEDLNTSQSDQW